MVHHPSEILQPTRASHLLEIDRLLQQPELNRTAVEEALAVAHTSSALPAWRDRESSLLRQALNLLISGTTTTQ